MRNILVYVPQKEKKSFAEILKGIWLAPTAELARKRAYDVIDSYAKRFPKAVQCLEEGGRFSGLLYIPHAGRSKNLVFQHDRATEP